MRAAWVSLALLALLGVCPPASQAGTLNISWVLPQLCADGTGITGCPLTAVSVYSAQCTGIAPLPNPIPSKLVTLGPTATSFAAINTPAGTTWCVTATASSQGGESAQSATTFAAVLVPPGAPAIQNISSTLKTVGTAVYLASQIPNGWSFLAVGTVPVGTPCMAGHGVEGYNIVLQGSGITVTWNSAVQPLAIVAICQ